MFPIIQAGPFAIQSPGLFLIAGFYFGLYITTKKLLYSRIHPNFISNLTLTCLLMGIISSRIAMIIQYPNAFFQSPLSIISITPDLFNLPAGFLGAVIAGIVYINNKQLNLPSVLDTLTPLFATLMVAIGFANLASGNSYGTITNLPWAIYLHDEFRHPSQIYEIISAVVILVIIYVSNKYLSTISPGTCVIAFVCLSAISRLFLESFRAESHVIFFGIRTVQIISWVIMSLSALWIVAAYEKYQKSSK